MPAVEWFVRGRFEHYDPSFLSADPAFTHAHITVLAPFLPAVDSASLAVVESLLAATPPITFTLDRLETFPNGVIYLPPDPDGPFRELTERFVAAFPQCPPYGGQFPDIVPHLTLDQLSAEVTVESTRSRLADAVPVTCVADRIDLVWYEPHRTRVLRQLSLGG